MLTRKTLTRINARPQGRLRWPLVALVSVAAALAALLLLSKTAALAMLAIGVGGTLFVFRRERAARVVPLVYDLDVESGARFVEIGEACDGLAGSEALWLVERWAATKVGANGSSSAASIPERRHAEAGRMETPGIRANVEIRGIDAGDLKVLFFPEGVLLLRHGCYRAVSYESLAVSLSFERVIEDEDVPADAEVVGRERRYKSEDGSLERSFGPNPKLPVVLYGLLRLTHPAGLDLSLRVSDRAAAARFAQTFGAKEPERPRAKRPPRGETLWPGAEKKAREAVREDEAKGASAARVALGLSSGATNGEITAAYRNLARIYHPDKVANLPPEIREFADSKMKEINAAYARLKRRSGSGVGNRDS